MLVSQNTLFSNKLQMRMREAKLQSVSSKGRRRLRRFRPVSIVLNNDNPSGPGLNRQLGFEVTNKLQKNRKV